MAISMGFLLMVTLINLTHYLAIINTYQVTELCKNYNAT